MDKGRILLTRGCPTSTTRAPSLPPLPLPASPRHARELVVVVALVTAGPKCSTSTCSASRPRRAAPPASLGPRRRHRRRRLCRFGGRGPPRPSPWPRRHRVGGDQQRDLRHCRHCRPLWPRQRPRMWNFACLCFSSFFFFSLVDDCLFVLFWIVSRVCPCCLLGSAFEMGHVLACLRIFLFADLVHLLWKILNSLVSLAKGPMAKYS